MKLGHALLVALGAAAVAIPAAFALPDAGGAGPTSTGASVTQEVRDALAGRSSLPGSSADRTPSQQAALHAKAGGASAPASADTGGGFEWATVGTVAVATALVALILGAGVVVVRQSLTRHPPTGPPTAAAR